MSYYIGFRFGWVRVGRHLLAWQDAQYYPRFSYRWRVGKYNVWFK